MVTLTRQKIIIFSLINLLVLLVLLVPLYFVYQEYQKTKTKLADTQAITQGDVDTLVKKVNELMELPAEMPTVATVSDVEQLKSQPFFTKAQNGDRVLVYRDARKAILYDPVNHKIREVGPVDITEPTPDVSQSNAGGQTAGAADSTAPSILRAITVALINGTTTEGLTSLAENALVEANANTRVVGRAFAQRRDYPETIVVDATGTRQAEASAVGRVLKAKVTTLPQEEQPTYAALDPKPDIIILLGADFVARTGTNLSPTALPTVSPQ